MISDLKVKSRGGAQNAYTPDPKVCDPRNQAAAPLLIALALHAQDRDDLDVHDRLVRLAALDLLDALHDVHALHDAAEDGVLVVEPRARRRRDEELRAVGVGAGVGHREGEGAVVAQRAVELVLELVAPDGGAAGAVAERVARLAHEPLDDAVEDDAVVVAWLGLGSGVI